jgi:hypothetical protein
MPETLPLEFILLLSGSCQNPNPHKDETMVCHYKEKAPGVKPDAFDFRIEGLSAAAPAVVIGIIADNCDNCKAVGFPGSDEKSCYAELLLDKIRTAYNRAFP